MYLKRLDVQGFKSFAHKTSLDFSHGVTCIIGPNGTGKTNVADALRWVLGEHASRALRARRTEEIIFAGSDNRAAMGVAEVDITLDNAEHWLPIEFEEVVVSRRAYRDGENEYLINGSRVRLRDVVDLFLRAKVGQNSYAFMGQGMVEQALSLRPEDRRALIEEAADVRMYRHKLEDARDRLKATRENLERVDLLVREIAPRINQLERQANRAVKYRELTRELAAALHVWYGHQWREVNQRLLASTGAQDQRNEERERVRRHVRACEDGLAQLRAAIDERRAEIASREERLRGLQDYVRDLERREALDSDRRGLLAERRKEIETDIALLHEEAGTHDSGDEPGVADGPEAEERLATARARYDDVRAALALVDDQLIGLRSELASQEHATRREREAIAELSKRLADSQETAARAERERFTALQERRAVIASLAAWALEYAGTRAEVPALEPVIEGREQDLARESGALAALKHEQATLEDEVALIRGQIESIVVRLELLETLDVQPQAPDAGVRMILEAGGVIKRATVPTGIDLPGVLGLIGQMLRVPPGLEKAIEAALAENLFAIVVQREADLRRATQLLVTSDAGRATLYALDSFHEVRPLNLIKERSVLGVASQLVRCDSKYRKLVDTLLGRTVIVEDLAMAQRMIRRGLATAAATLDGILVRPVGSISAGSYSTVQASFVREREVGEYPVELARLRALVEARETSLGDASRASGDVAERATAAEAVLASLRERKRRAEAELSVSRSRLAGFAANLRALAVAAGVASEQAARLAAWRERTEADHAAAEQRQLGIAAEAERVRRAIEDAASRRDTLAASVVEVSRHVAELEVMVRAERERVAPSGSALARLRAQLQTKAEQRERLTDESRTLDARVASTRHELDARSSELDGLRIELEPARRELSQLESRERSMTAELAEANACLHIVERAVLDAENDARVQNDEVESLRETLETEGFVSTPAGEVERVPEADAESAAEPATDVAAGHGDGNGRLPSWMRSDDDDALPPMRGGSAIDATEVRDRIAELRGQIRALGPVNDHAAIDYGESRERYDFLTGQLTDLRQTEEQLLAAGEELEGVIRERFRTTFKLVNREFERYFEAFFRGGAARLELGERDAYGLPGVEIIAQPPGKKLGSMALLSGGERALTAVALLFALLQANPSPICVLDEVDAALDEANVGRFVDELRELSQRTQFVIITHNRRTIEMADTIYGVSMGADSVSRVLSLRLDDVPEDLSA